MCFSDLELKRVLKVGGTLLITVPFGKHRNYAFFQQFDYAMVKSILSNFQLKESSVHFYLYTPDGWQLSDEERCKNTDYFDVRTANKTPPYKQAASGAIACIKLIK